MLLYPINYERFELGRIKVPCQARSCTFLVQGAEKGITWIDGSFPVNTDGGYMTRGNCIGATGAAAMAEVVYQLRGEAGPRQVTNVDPKVGLAHNMGAGIQTSIAILKK